MKEKPALYLLPNLLGTERPAELFLPQSVNRAVEKLNGLIGENEMPARRFLSHFLTPEKVRALPVALFRRNDPNLDLDFYLDPIEQGQTWGLVSDAGLPCIADPGYLLVARAKERGIRVRAFVGPSSIFLALMQSGLPGQKFTFHGYLSKDPIHLAKELRSLNQTPNTHIFMERPYRNQTTLNTLLETLSPETRLCVAVELTQPGQKVLTYTIKQWKNLPLPNIDKKNCLFLFY